MQILARAMISDEEQIQQEIKFIQEAVTQLLKARHVLKCSYVYGYYLEQIGYKKSVFEFMQVSGVKFVQHISY
jgi:ankyrin repeat/IBR domain-containing protein 1